MILEAPKVLMANGQPIPTAKCIAWECRRPIPDGHQFCKPCFRDVPGPLKNEISTETKRLRSIGAREASPRLIQLIEAAIAKNLQARGKRDPELRKRVIDFAEKAKRVQSAARLGLVVPNGGQFGIPQK